jgi:CubicO group peptidase (beta-lactamase class C family)
MEHYNTVKDGLEIFINDSLLHEPGTRFQYSSHGYNLLSAVIESASGMEFLTFMNENVFTPAEMKYTVADLKDTLILYRSGFYSMNAGKIINAPYVDNSYKWAGGGYLSTSEDIVKFGNAILYNKLFPESIKSELITTQYTTSGDTTNYGMGWGSGVNEYGRAHYGHGGGSIGGSCQLLVFPEEELVVAYLTNDTRSAIGKGIHDIAEIFMREE